MKILFFIDCLTSGGKERRLTELMKALIKRPEVDFELVLMSKDIHYKEVYDLKIKVYFIIRRLKKDISVFSRFYNICRRYKPDIVHCWDSMTATYSIPACKLLGIKLINGMVVDTLVKQNIFNKLWFRARLTFPFSDIIVGNSDTGLASYRAPLKKSVCIYNGMDLSRFVCLKEPAILLKEILEEISDNLFIAGMVAAFEERKDYQTLVETAVSMVAQRNDIRFILVGDGTYFRQIKDSVPVSLQNNIIFLGKRSDVESIINIFNVGILLTNAKVHGEGISNSIIEYMALGKPVIATLGGGTNEVVTDGANGFLIDPGNADQLKEKINFLMSDKKMAEALGNKGRQLVRNKFEINFMTDKYTSLYSQLLHIKSRKQTTK